MNPSATSYWLVFNTWLILAGAGAVIVIRRRRLMQQQILLLSHTMNAGLKRRRERSGYAMSAKEFKVVSVQGRDILTYNWSGARLKSLDTSVIERDIAPYLGQGWEMTWVLPVAHGTLDAVLIFLERPKTIT